MQAHRHYTTQLSRYNNDTSDLGKVSINMEWVVVPTQSVECCLDGQGLVEQRGIGRSRGSGHRWLQREMSIENCVSH